MTHDGDIIRALIPLLPVARALTDPHGWLAARAHEADQGAEVEDTETGCTCGLGDHL